MQKSWFLNTVSHSRGPNRLETWPVLSLGRKSTGWARLLSLFWEVRKYPQTNKAVSAWCVHCSGYQELAWGPLSCQIQINLSISGCWFPKYVSFSVLSDSLQPTDCNPPSSSVHGVLQTRIVEWVAIPFSRGLPDSRIKPGFCIAVRFFAVWATWQAAMSGKIRNWPLDREGKERL